MSADLARLKRLRRLEKIRAIAKQAAATGAAEAESTLAQLSALAARTGRLAADYAGRSDPNDGLALQHLVRFAAGLQGICTATNGDAVQAKVFADRKLDELAQAEQRRSAVEDRADRHARDLTARSTPALLGKRRGFGTGIE